MSLIGHWGKHRETLLDGERRARLQTESVWGGGVRVAGGAGALLPARAGSTLEKRGEVCGEERVCEESGRALTAPRPPEPQWMTRRVGAMAGNGGV